MPTGERDAEGREIWEVSDADVEEAIIELYAGRAAELHFAPANEDTRRLLGSASDDERAESLGRSLPGEWTPARERQLRERAGALIRDNWPLVEAIARELLVHRALDGDEVSLIVERERGDPEAGEILAMRRARGWLYRPPSPD